MKNMKKIGLVGIAVLAAMVIVFNACKTDGDSDDGGGHTHDWGPWVVTDATATEDGFETRTCTRDSAHIETRAGGSKLLAYTLNGASTEYSVSGYTGTSVSVVIPATFGGKPVKSVGVNALINNTAISSVTIPASVESIGSSAFQECTNLTSVTFASGIQLDTIGIQAFNGCSKLTSVIIPASVTTIDNVAFAACTKLASVTFASVSQLDTIGFQAFYACYDLASITIPASVTTMGSQAFHNWQNTQKIIVPFVNITAMEAAWGTTATWNSGAAVIQYTPGA